MNARFGDARDAVEARDAAVDEVVDALRALRKTSQKSRYKSSALPELPSRAAVVDIVGDLVAILYPRHFGPSHLTIETVDGFVSDDIETDNAFARRADRQRIAPVRRSDAGRGRRRKTRRIADAFLGALPRVRSLLDTDLRAAFEAILRRAASTRSCSAIRGSRPSRAIVSRTSSIVSARRCWRASSPRSRIPRPASTFIRAPRSARLLHRSRRRRRDRRDGATSASACGSTRA